MKGIRCISVVMLLALALFGVNRAEAASLTIDFTGKLTGITGTNSVGGVVGNDVSGSIMATDLFGPFDTSTPPTTAGSQYSTANTAWTFSLGPSLGGLTTIKLNTQYIDPTTANYYADFYADGFLAGFPGDNLSVHIDAISADSSIPPLTLSTLPATLADWATYFAVRIRANGTLNYDGSKYDFDLTEAKIATTPLPASLVFMLTAFTGLAGVGVMKRFRP